LCIGSLRPSTARQKKSLHNLCGRLGAATVPGHATQQVTDYRVTVLVHLASWKMMPTVRR
jgi:hypothetical protein